jgi:hypothetical protein
MRLSGWHEKIDENGVGKCSVPMWCDGIPAGFCDEPAYGPQEKGQKRYGKYEPAWNMKWFDGINPVKFTLCEWNVTKSKEHLR